MDHHQLVAVTIPLLLLLIALIPLLLHRRRRHHQLSTTHSHEEEPQPIQTERAVRPPRASRMRRRPAAGASTSAAAETEEAMVESDDDEILEDRASTKKERKKQEREAQRQAEEAARESRGMKQDRYADMRRKKDEEREALERRMEEEAMERKAKEDEAAALEFDKWKGEFSIDAEGTTENEEKDEKQGLLYNFVEYIKKQKCVPLEDLAAEFKLRTQDCINRITSLESMGRLSGVMDDRGKYIYISPEEMQAVADYIKREGRVSISHLASQSNQFIDLEPKPQLEVEQSSDGISVA